MVRWAGLLVVCGLLAAVAGCGGDGGGDESAADRAQFRRRRHGRRRHRLRLRARAGEPGPQGPPGVCRRQQLLQPQLGAGAGVDDGPRRARADLQRAVVLVVSPARRARPPAVRRARPRARAAASPQRRQPAAAGAPVRIAASGPCDRRRSGRGPDPHHDDAAAGALRRRHPVHPPRPALHDRRSGVRSVAQGRADQPARGPGRVRRRPAGGRAGAHDRRPRRSGRRGRRRDLRAGQPRRSTPAPAGPARSGASAGRPTSRPSSSRTPAR